MREFMSKVFLGALAIRWLYDVVLFAAMGPAGLMGADSHGYLRNAEIMAAKLLDGALHGWAALGSDLSVMPLYPWLLTLNIVTFGSLAPLTVVMLQGAIDSVTCLLIYKIADSIDPFSAASFT